MELYILRHGITEWNKVARFQGQVDIPLAPEGVSLAEEAAVGMKHIKFDHCFSSPLSRARKTAEIILGDSDIEIVNDKRIMEMSFGDWEGLVSRGKHADITPEQRLALYDPSENGYRPNNGEAIRDVIKRAGDFLESMKELEKEGAERVLVSTHGVCSRAILQHYWQDGDFWHGNVPPNCCVSILTMKDGKLTDLQQDIIFYESEPIDYYGNGNE